MERKWHQVGKYQWVYGKRPMTLRQFKIIAAILIPTWIILAFFFIKCSSRGDEKARAYFQNTSYVVSGEVMGMKKIDRMYIVEIKYSQLDINKQYIYTGDYLSAIYDPEDEDMYILLSFYDSNPEDLIGKNIYIDSRNDEVRIDGAYTDAHIRNVDAYGYIPKDTRKFLECIDNDKAVRL